jgi:hypothetical protein
MKKPQACDRKDRPVLPSGGRSDGWFPSPSFFRDAAIGTRTRVDQPAARIGLEPSRPRRRDNDRLRGSAPIAIAYKRCRALQRGLSRQGAVRRMIPARGALLARVRQHRLTNETCGESKKLSLVNERTEEPRPRHGSSSRRAHARVLRRGHFQHIERTAGARPFVEACVRRATFPLRPSKPKARGREPLEALNFIHGEHSR